MNEGGKEGKKIRKRKRKGGRKRWGVKLNNPYVLLPSTSVIVCLHCREKNKQNKNKKNGKL